MKCTVKMSIGDKKYIESSAKKAGVEIEDQYQVRDMIHLQLACKTGQNLLDFGLMIAHDRLVEDIKKQQK